MEIEITRTDIERAHHAALIMEQSLKSHFTIAQLAEKVMLPEKRLKAVFKKLYGVGLYTYLRQLRMEKAKALLLEGKPIKVIIHVIGYENESNFCKAFRNAFKESPRTWRRKEMKKAV
ncbi:helix-turn-helix transcriptional regulator [Pseudoflavitalea sp. X16]|uniref:helix-turn-helix domain-containing protein n=1 Tax=Paraflavitalea devenefica TaxID=2716334 RepID=UPI001421C97E|nr:AraC family transcriptional regulator [Paraflavitalea devenefica]NII25822.1 helix-turn-helix transcriptional regulator [Paraflavitalea devenefica]